MPLVLKDLKNSRMLSNALHDASPEEIQDIIDKLTVIKEETVARLAKQASINEERRIKLGAMANELKENNISIEDLMGYLGVNVKKRKLKIRYRYVGVDGLTYEWSGQGRTPRAMQQLIERDGTTKEDYLIPEEQQS